MKQKHFEWIVFSWFLLLSLVYASYNSILFDTETCEIKGFSEGIITATEDLVFYYNVSFESDELNYSVLLNKLGIIYLPLVDHFKIKIETFDGLILCEEEFFTQLPSSDFAIISYDEKIASEISKEISDKQKNNLILFTFITIILLLIIYVSYRIYRMKKHNHHRIIHKHKR
ncbi:MAG: hypothetical protein QXS41_00595 [Candidatus Woesearchaeota archaeon]